jgi:hypothetical protein
MTHDLLSNGWMVKMQWRISMNELSSRLSNRYPISFDLVVWKDTIMQYTTYQCEKRYLYIYAHPIFT